MRLRHLFVLVLSLFASVSAQASRVFTGTAPSGTHWRIEAPDAWRTGDPLVLYLHGLSFDSGDDDPSLGPLRAQQLAEGYAVAASAYGQRGWAVFTAERDTQEVLDAVQSNLGTPSEIIPFGGSLGGLLALKAAESPALRERVHAVYALCPAASGSRLWDQALDLRLSYDTICKDAGDLPRGDAPYPWALNLSQIPPRIDLENRAQVLAALLPIVQCTGVGLPSEVINDAMVRRRAQLKAVNGITDNDFLVTQLAYAAFAMSDLVRANDKLENKSGMGNLGVDYGDGLLNANIARVTPDALAALRLKWLSDFRGEIGGTKVLSLHTSRDQLVVPANQSVLRTRVPAGQLVSALVREDESSHCGFNLAEGMAGWEALRAWRAGGAQPTLAELQSRCAAAMAAGSDGPCRFDGEQSVPALDSVIRPRPAQAGESIDARFTGHWFDPARSGEGVSLEILNGDIAIVYFLTYPPAWMFQAGNPQPVRDQVWMVGVGRIRDNGIAVDDVRYYSPQGAPPAVANQHWGALWLSFSDCTHGRLRWDGPSGWGSKEVPIERLTSLFGLGCGVQPQMLAQPQVSGSWFDPARSGSGFHFEQLDATHTLVMYHGAPNGTSSVPGWYVGVASGDLAAGVPSIQLERPYGPHFGADYDPNALQHDMRFFLNLRLGCNTGTASFGTVLDWDGPGVAMNLQRLTTPAGVPACP
jgi:hypothetical protein